MSEKKTKKGMSPIKIALIAVAATLGTLLVIVIILFVLLMILNPFGTKLPSISGLLGNETESSYDHPLLSTDQEIMLESVGIDVETLPTSVSTDQQECATAALGEARVAEIAGGAAPSLSDVLKARSCFE
ncbi:MAG: hypothetical protein ABH846_04550 [Patescibacteria group bacterium]